MSTSQPGRIGILIDSTEPITVSSAPIQLLTVKFKTITEGEVAGTWTLPTLSLTDSVAGRSISDADGNLLSVRSFDSNAIVLFK